MSEILFLVHRVPFPPDRGDKIRSHHILHALARIAPVHVGCLSDGLSDRLHEGELARAAASYFIAPRSKLLPLAGFEALATGRPVSLTAFDEPELADWVARTCEERQIATIYVFSGQMGQYVPQGWKGRLIVDLVDVDSAKFEAFADEAAFPMRWVHRREAKLLRREEARLAAMADHTLLVSEAEANLFKSTLPTNWPAKVSWLGNGIDASLFDPTSIIPQRELARSGPSIVFTGQMDYHPNVEAAVRMIDRIMPYILAARPDCTFHVVGRCPTAELVRRNGRNGARIWGEVPDVRPFLAAADLVVTPLSIARGVQNKVLEAMAMARCVVMSPDAASGIPGADGVDYLTASTDEHFAAQAISLLHDVERANDIGASARRTVQQERNWNTMLAPLSEMLVDPVSHRGTRHAA